MKNSILLGIHDWFLSKNSLYCVPYQASLTEHKMLGNKHKQPIFFWLETEQSNLNRFTNINRSDYTKPVTNLKLVDHGGHSLLIFFRKIIQVCPLQHALVHLRISTISQFRGLGFNTETLQWMNPPSLNPNLYLRPFCWQILQIFGNSNSELLPWGPLNISC